MTTPLERLRVWATEMAATDPDESARPLWGQIRDEVATYLADPEDRAPGTLDEPLWGAS